MLSDNVGARAGIGYTGSQTLRVGRSANGRARRAEGRGRLEDPREVRPPRRVQSERLVSDKAMERIVALTWFKCSKREKNEQYIRADPRPPSP
jgi:hypothetical protein